MIYTKPEMVLMAAAAAERHNLEPAFICALIEAATHWNPTMVEWNPPHDQKPFDPWTDDYDAYQRQQHTYGLMQVQGTEIGNLMQPDENLEIGCRRFAEFMKVTGTYEQALRLWWNAKDPPKLKAVVQMTEKYKEFLAMRCVS